MRQYRSEAFVLKSHGDVRECLCKMFQEYVDILCGLGRSAVHIDRITDHEEHYLLIFSVFFEIFYYLCRLDCIQCRRKDSERVAYRNTHTLPAVVYAYYSVHQDAKLR